MERRWLVGGSAVCFALMVALVPWTAIPGLAQQTPRTNQALEEQSGDDFDRTFLQGIVAQQAMTVRMARPAAQNASHQELKTFAQGMVDTQTREIAQWRSWAKDWYSIDIADPLATPEQSSTQAGPPSLPSLPNLPTPPNIPEGAASGEPPNLAQPGAALPKPGNLPSGLTPPAPPSGNAGPPAGDGSLVSELAKLPSQRLDVVFLALKVPHHQRVIDLAKLATGRAAHQELVDVAKRIADRHASEVDQMNGWLRSWYGL